MDLDKWSGRGDNGEFVVVILYTSIYVFVARIFSKETIIGKPARSSYATMS